MKIKTIGIDLAKNVFQLHGVDEYGKVILKQRLSQKKFALFFSNLESCLIGMEACGSAHYWARRLRQQGHEVRLISPQYVKPYVKTNKNDANDAEAICEAVSRPNMRFVQVKTVEQQDIQFLHRIRSRLVKERTALVNQTRGLLREYGVFIAEQLGSFRAQVPSALEDGENELTTLARELVAEQYLQLQALDTQIKEVERRIDTVYRGSELCQRLGRLEGAGPMISTALVAAVGDGKCFNNGRQLSAWLGLVPRQHSSGGKNRLLGISKRGESYLRMLLIHGARSVLYRSRRKTDAKSRWLQGLEARRGPQRACVALANKNARVLWALMQSEADYCPTS